MGPTSRRRNSAASIGAEVRGTASASHILPPEIDSAVAFAPSAMRPVATAPPKNSRRLVDRFFILLLAFEHRAAAPQRPACARNATVELRHIRDQETNDRSGLIPGS